MGRKGGWGSVGRAGGWRGLLEVQKAVKGGGTDATALMQHLATFPSKT
jgi:hypothetical protein